MFVFGTTMLKCEGYSDKMDFFDNNDRNDSASNLHVACSTRGESIPNRTDVRQPLVIVTLYSGGKNSILLRV